MTTISYTDLQAKAQLEGGSSSDEPLPAGEGYFGEIVRAGAKAKENGFSLWWNVKVLVGPDAGRTGFINQQLNPENGKQLDIFFRITKSLGIDFSKIPDGTPPEDVAKLILGTKITFDIKHNPSKNGDGRIFANFENIKRVTSDVEPEPAPVAAAPSAPSSLPF